MGSEMCIRDRGGRGAMVCRNSRGGAVGSKTKMEPVAVVVIMSLQSFRWAGTIYSWNTYRERLFRRPRPVTGGLPRRDVAAGRFVIQARILSIEFVPGGRLRDR